MPQNDRPQTLGDALNDARRAFWELAETCKLELQQAARRVRRLIDPRRSEK